MENAQGGGGSTSGGDTAGATSSSSSEPKNAREFDRCLGDLIKALQDAAKAHGDEGVIAITDVFVENIYIQRDIIVTQFSCAKPDKLQFLLKPVQAAVSRGKDLKAKYFKVGNHCQTVIDGLNMFAWFATAELEEYMDEHASAVDFYGNKVLQMKQDPDTAWYKSYKALVKGFADFIKDRKDNITNWTGKQGFAEDFFSSQCGMSQKMKEGGGAPQTNSLLAEVQAKALSTQQNMQHVSKQDRKDFKAGGSGPVAKKATPGASVKKEEVKKEPTKTFKYNTHYIEHHGKEVIQFKEDEINPNIGFALIKCKDTTLVVPSKCKTVMLEACQGVKVVVNGVMSNIEVINCKKITIQAKVQLPQLAIERTEGCKVWLFDEVKNCKVHTTCCQSIVLNYPKVNATEDDEWLDIGIPETYETLIQNDKAVCKPLEGME